MNVTGSLLRVILLALLLGAGVLFLPRLASRLFPSGGEEAVKRSSADLSGEVGRIHQAVLDSVSGLGIDPSTVEIREEEAVEREGQRVVPRRLNAFLPEGTTREGVERAFQQHLKSSSPTAQVYFTTPDPVTLGVRISTGRFPTHHILLSESLPEDPSFPPEHPPVLALLVDGVGEASPAVEEALSWRLPVTLAIRPYQPLSVAYARDAARSSKEVLLHLDSEALRSPDPLMAPRDAVPFVGGVYVRGGGVELGEGKPLRALVEALSASGLPLLLAQPPPGGAALAWCRVAKVPAAEAQVIFQPEKGEKAVVEAMIRARNLAVRQGRAIVVAPADAAGLAVLKKFGVGAREKGYRFAFASEVVRRGTERPESGEGRAVNSP